VSSSEESFAVLGIYVSENIVHVIEAVGLIVYLVVSKGSVSVEVCHDTSDLLVFKALVSILEEQVYTLGELSYGHDLTSSVFFLEFVVTSFLDAHKL
jgi:hypothetical protein